MVLRHGAFSHHCQRVSSAVDPRRPAECTHESRLVALNWCETYCISQILIGIHLELVICNWNDCSPWPLTGMLLEFRVFESMGGAWIILICGSAVGKHRIDISMARTFNSVGDFWHSELSSLELLEIPTIILKIVAFQQQKLYIFIQESRCSSTGLLKCICQLRHHSI